jgi:hypothetical protein
MELEILATEPPQIKFTPTGADVSVTGDINVYVILNNGTSVPAFSLTGTVSADGKVRLYSLFASNRRK